MFIDCEEGKFKNEDDVVNLLTRELSKIFKEKGYLVSKGIQLLYRVVSINGDYLPIYPTNVKRSDTYSFQTDILIYRNAKKDSNHNNRNEIVPLVVLEVKLKEFGTTHVIEHSYKAICHKRIYPYLRYGFIIVFRDDIYFKFFIHNQGIDFAYALDPCDQNDFNNFVKIVDSQIKYAEDLLVLHQTMKKPKYYTSNIEIR